MVGLGLSLACSSAFAAQLASDFYKGKTILVIIGYSAGGGYDLYARVLAQYLGRHIPGNPTVIPQNMPGAGSLKAANYLYSVAPKDGLTIGTFARGMGSAQLIGQAGFDARNFTWIGSPTKDTTLCISWATTPLKSWKDVLKTPSIFGGEGSDSDPDIFAKLYKNVFGAKLRLATGFPGTTDIGLAMQRGEIQGLCGISWSTVKAEHRNWLTGKKIRILLQGSPNKDKELPNVPMADEFAKTAQQRQILDFVQASQVMARPFAAPPGIPADRKKVLRAAFDATMKDPDFLADAKKIGIDIRPVTGAEIDKLVADLYATPKPVIAEAARAISN
jgi:tripartite-type tricarboxylate transporter receptor subunit TctC